MVRNFTLLALFLFISITGFSQNIWNSISENEANRSGAKREIIPLKYKVYKLNTDALMNKLKNLPAEFSSAFRTGTSNIVEIPMPDGSLQRFRVCVSPIMEQELIDQFPEIQTFAGQGIDDPAASIRMDWTPYYGFHAMIISPNGHVYIDPYAQWNTEEYISYYRRDFIDKDPYHELPVRTRPGRERTNRITAAAPCRGTQLWSYRLAVSNTDEYAVAATGLPNPTKAQVLAKIVTSVNRVTGVYESELSVRLILIANNINIVYNNDPGSPDPYTGNDDGVTLLDESHNNITAVIGSANFDVGHTFSTGAGGVAYLGVVCDNSAKGGGVTGLANPVGDPYDIDYVAHEMGHQFGGNHTFYAAFPTCSANGNYGPAAIGGTGYEVGSGTTIQAYAGICVTDNIQPNSDPHFHTVSYDEIINYLSTQSCQVATATGNSIPLINAMNNNGITIPVNTPFTLTGSATDPNGDPITYCWEQWDEGLSPSGAVWNSGAANPFDPQFRSRVPKLSGSRTFPDMSVILANYPVNPPSAMNGLKGETLSQVARQMRFRLTVRDNRSGGGGISTGGEGCAPGFTSTFVVNVDAAGPFSVVAPNGGETWQGGSTQTVTWNATGTNVAPINCATVNIKLSTDGGLTYPIILLAGTPNDGSQTITVPNINPTTNNARIIVEAADNIFFDISNANFTIQYNVVLPLTMKDFTVRPINRNNAELNWGTLFESNTRGFEVQRSIGNSNNFSVIGFVQAAGNTNSGHQYRFTDLSLPLNTTIYYRLRQTDNDGRSSLSEVRTIRFNDQGIYLSLQPNPVKNDLTIVNNGEPITKVNVQLITTDGRLVFANNLAFTGDRLQLNVASLPAGVYTLRITNNEFVWTGKLIKE